MKKVLNQAIALVLSVVALVPISAYADNIPSSWAMDEVNAAINVNLVPEAVKNNYQTNITREQFCEMVVRTYEKISGETPDKGSVFFNDTNNSEILKAANLGIVSGYGNGLFAPNDLINREQIAVMLVRMIDKAISYVNVYNSNIFTDSNDISNWALPSVTFAYDRGIMQGVGNNRIAPLDNTTCEQAILMIYRTFKKYYILYDVIGRIPDFDEKDINSQEFIKNFIFNFYTGKSNGTGYKDGLWNRYDWDEEQIKNDYETLFGYNMPIYNLIYDTDCVVYKDKIYSIGASDPGGTDYFYSGMENDGVDGYFVTFKMNFDDDYLGEKVVDVVPSESSKYGFTIKSISTTLRK